RGAGGVRACAIDPAQTVRRRRRRTASAAIASPIAAGLPAGALGAAAQPTSLLELTVPLEAWMLVEAERSPNWALSAPFLLPAKSYLKRSPSPVCSSPARFQV